MASSQGNSEERAKLLEQAQDEFSKKNYEASLAVLSTLEAFEGSDERIKHNKMIVQFYKSDLRCVNTILREFEEIVNRDQAKASITPELAYLHYNYALMLYHKRQHKKALKVLRPLLQLVKSGDHYDEVLSAHTCLLCMTIYMDTADLDSCQAILDEAGGPNKKYFPFSTTNLFDEPPGGVQWDFNDQWQLMAHRLDILKRADDVKLTMKLDSSEYSVLRAHQHYLRHDIQMAAKELSKKFANDPFTVQRNGENQDTVLANNMGLIHFSVRHYAMAVRFFQYSLNFDSIASENVLGNAALVEMSAARRPDILYNLGISMLFLERPQEAFDCLLVPLNYHHNNPRLWLRVAEACIMMHRMNGRNQANNHLLTCGVIGSGMLRKFILKPTEGKYKTDLSDNYAIPNPNLEFATLCLSNALMLVRNLLRVTKEAPCLPSRPISRVMIEKLMATILSNLCYTHLQLGDFRMTVKYGKQLLAQQSAPSSFRFLANMYCAEALAMTDNINNMAVFPHVNPKLLDDLDHPKDFSQASPGWQCSSLELTKAIFFYNTSVTLVMMRDYSRGAVLLSKCNHPDIIDHVMKLKVYLDLCMGSTDLPRNLALIEDKCLK